MKIRKKRITALAIAACGLAIASFSPASYFPDPTVTSSYDTIWGNITGPTTFGSGDEIAGYDSGGTVRYRYTLTANNIYGTTGFYGPPTGPGGDDTDTFTWKLYDASEGIEYSASADLSNWGTWLGTKGTYQVDITRGDPSGGTIPEPSTWLVMIGLAVSGAFIWKKNRRADRAG